MKIADIKALLDRGLFARTKRALQEELASAGEEHPEVGNLGGLWIDLGRFSGDRGAIEIGVRLTRVAVRQDEHPVWKFNLANGLLVLLPESLDYMRRVAFDPALGEVCSLFYGAIDGKATGGPEPRLNFATALQKAGRSVEALDIVLDVLRQYQDLAEAWAAYGDILWGVCAFFGQTRHLLWEAVETYGIALSLPGCPMLLRRDIQSRLDRLRVLVVRSGKKPHSAYPPERNAIRETMGRPVSWDRGLVEFVWTSGLGLNLCTGCRLGNAEAFDRFPIQGWSVDPNDIAATEVWVAAMNQIVEDFSVARRLLWLSRTPDAGAFGTVEVPTDGFPSSPRSAILRASFREAYGILDRLAAIINARAGVGIDARKVYFHNLFFADEKVRRLREPVGGLIESIGLRALMYLSWSFEKDQGRFAILRELRNRLQHGVVLPVAREKIDATPWVAIPADELEARTLEMLRLARAAIVYASETLQAIEIKAADNARASGAEISRRVLRVVDRRRKGID